MSKKNSNEQKNSSNEQITIQFKLTKKYLSNDQKQF